MRRPRQRVPVRSRPLVFVATAISAVLVAGMLASPAAAQTCTDQFSPQLDSDWGTAGNWSKQAVPTSSDVACWAAGATVVVSSRDSAATAKAIEGGNLTIGSGGMLSLAGPDASAVANFTESGGALNGPGSLGVTGDFSWTGGQISVSTAIAITQTGGGAFSITGTGSPTLGGGQISTSSNRASLGTIPGSPHIGDELTGPR